jgi:hypothetical protein
MVLKWIWIYLHFIVRRERTMYRMHVRATHFLYPNVDNIWVCMIITTPLHVAKDSLASCRIPPITPWCVHAPLDPHVLLHLKIIFVIPIILGILLQLKSLMLMHHQLIYVLQHRVPSSLMNPSDIPWSHSHQKKKKKKWILLPLPPIFRSLFISIHTLLKWRKKKRVNIPYIIDLWAS